MRTFSKKPKPAQQATPAKSTIPSRTHFGQSREVKSILHLQRTIENRTVQRFLKSNAEEILAGSTTTASTRFGHDFTRIPIFSPSPVQFQPQLTISTPGDVSEQEADQVADQVVHMPEPQVQLASAGCQTHESVPKNEHLPQRSLLTGETREIALSHVDDVLRSEGQTLPLASRTFFEDRFGYDFGQVRVHTDKRAAESAKELNAWAYTLGRNIVFGAGQFALGSTDGRRLLAHELTHVLQQSTGSQSWHIARDELDAGVAEASLPPLPRFLYFDDAMPLIEEALAFVDPVAGVGDFRRVEEILLRFNASEVFQLLTTLDQNLYLERVRQSLTDTRLMYEADVVFYARRDWSQAPIDRMRDRLAALDRSEQDSIVAYIESHASFAAASETFPISVLARRQVGYLESVRRERDRARREAAVQAGQEAPPEMTLGEVISEDVEQRSSPQASVEEQQRREAAALSPRVPGIISSVQASVAGTELETVIRGKTFSYEPERAIREGFYGAQSGNSLIVGVAWVRDAEDDPRSVWPNIAHELGGHLEYGRTFSGQIVQEVLRDLPEDQRRNLLGSDEARRRLFNSFEYAETEIFAELREFRYGRSADDPRQDIPNKLNELRSWFEPIVLHAIIRYMWRRILSSSEILDEHKQFFVEQVAALEVTPRIRLR